MYQEDRFVLSHHQHAIDLSSFRVSSRHSWTYEGEEIRTVTCVVNAVWYRRKRGVTYACIGHLSHSYREKYQPPTAENFLLSYTDGRYGPTPEGRWDGENYWGAQKPETIQEHLAILRPMIDDYPSAPESYSTWWRF